MHLIILAAGIIIFDQISKHLVRLYIKGGSILIVIEDFFALTYVENRGGAWGILGNSEGTAFALRLVSLILTLLLLVLLRRFRHPYLRLALTMIAAGSTGNLIDRFVFSYVTDFLTFKFGNYFFPSFNVADSFIVLGTILLLILVCAVPEASHEFFSFFGLAAEKEKRDV